MKEEVQYYGSVHSKEALQTKRKRQIIIEYKSRDLCKTIIIDVQVEFMPDRHNII